MQALPLPFHYAREHFEHGVTSALQREGHVLTLGEVWIVRRWLSLPPAAASLYARLHGRRGSIFRTDRLQYAEIPDVGMATESLLQAGMVHPGRMIPLGPLIEAHTVPELRAACRALGFQQTGRRAELVAALLDGQTRAVLPGRCIRMRHQGLFRRLLRIYLGDHTGDLSRVVLDAMGLQSFVSYTPTTGPGLFRCRESLRDFEAALALLSTQRDEPGWAALAPEAVQQLRRLPLDGAQHGRFSARRLYDTAARRAVRAVEREEGPEEAAVLYQEILETGTVRPGAVALRLALCEGRTGNPAKGARLCAAMREEVAASPEALALERTGRRLARQAGADWQAAESLRLAPLRSLALPLAQAHPPRFETAQGPMPVEPAVVAYLAEQGRRAIHAESAPWTTLFGILFHSAIFAPVPGMLPCARMTAPLDLYTEGFSMKRRREVTFILNRIGAGDAPRMLEEGWKTNYGMSITGVHWDLLTLRELTGLVSHMGPAKLRSLMTLFAQDPRAVRSGMPDLLILPGQGADLPTSLLLAEVKGPGDVLRDNQRCWHNALLRTGLRVEVWQVEGQSPG